MMLESISDTIRNERIEDLFSRYHQIVYHYCLAKINYHQHFLTLIDDCVQEAFVLYIITYDKLSSHPNPAGWLCHTAWNRLRTKMRNANSRNKKLKTITDLEIISTPEIHDAIDRWANRDEAILKLAAIHALLTDMEQAVYQSYFVDELSVLDTAKITGLSENSVRSAVDRIRKRARSLENFFVILSILDVFLILDALSK